MKSAKKLEAAIRAAWFDPKMKASESRAAAIALIRARDKEIVEACKDAVANSQPLTAGELEARCERRLAIKALDSVLGTLG